MSKSVVGKKERGRDQEDDERGEAGACSRIFKVGIFGTRGKNPAPVQKNNRNENGSGMLPAFSCYALFMIDSHCHLAALDFAADVDAVIERASNVGIRQIVTISDAIEDIEPSRLIAEKNEHIFYTAGVHPHHAKEFDYGRDLPILRAEANHPKCKAIGEIGLDYHYMHSPKDMQQRVFEAQLLLAKELDLPAVVHCRDAVEDVWTIVSHVKPRKLVLHCCTEKWADIECFIAAGYFLSFTGIVTYPKAEVIRDTVKSCPITQLMIETDAPFLAPVLHRGKRNEPAFVIEVARTIATVKGLTLSEVDAATTANAVQFFGLPL